MNLVGEISFTYRTYRQMASAAQRRVWFYRLIAVLLVVCIGSLAIITRDVPTDAFVVVFLALAITGLPELVILRGWQSARRLQPFRYQFSDSGLAIQTSQTSAALRWEGITKVKAYRHAWFLTIAAARQRVPIPRAAFSPEAQAQLDAYLTGLPGLR